MNNMVLVRPSIEDKAEFENMMLEWEQLGERIVPGIMRNYKPTFHEFIELLERCNNGIGLSEIQVPSTLYILKNHNNRILGALSLRHRLTEELKMYGGHIGYGIRPSERNKGYATVMLKYAIEYVKELKIETVYISCDKDNIASSKVILNNGGVIEWEGYYKPVNREIKRFRISL